jgi:glycosyltransferase A (GT-A) superfamily protein (DUF2064 family)
LTDTLDQIDLLVDGLTNGLTESVQRVLLFDGDPTAWLRSGYDAVVQRGESLAERLANGFDELGPGIIVGMETPHAVSALGSGLAALQRGADTIGLATDGGYWAIGVSDVDRRVFHEVPMSASHTGLAQLRQLHRLHRGVHHLPMARDLDTLDDVVAASQRVHRTALVAAAKAVLAELESGAGISPDLG